MGKQLSIVALPEDELALVGYLRTTADIAIFSSFAPTREDLWISHPAEAPGRFETLYIWNTGFAWKPEYARVGPDSVDPARVGWYYVSNKNVAPILELSRTDAMPLRPGRLYWGKDFSAPQGLHYDAAGFGRWIDRVWRWVRKIGRKPPAAQSYDPYYLPAAWRHFNPSAEPPKSGCS